jgi:diguanylate cyclase (GGDEF)-like protein
MKPETTRLTPTAGRNYPRQRWLILGVSLCLAAGSVAAATSLAFKLRAQAIAQDAREASNLAYVLAEQIDRTFQSVGLVASGIVHRVQQAQTVEGLKQLAADAEIQALMRDRIAGHLDLDNLAIVAADGVLINRTRPGPTPKVDLSQRDYIQELRHQRPFATYISRPTESPTTGRWEITLAERISSSRGDFLGVIIGVLELHSLEEVFARVAIGPHGSISLSRSDGIHLARFPHVDALIGTSQAASDFFQKLVFKSRDGVVRVKSPIDGLERIVAAHRARHFPLVIGVTTSEDDALVEWRQQAVAIGLAAGISAVFFLLGGLGLIWWIEFTGRARADVAVARERELAQAEVAQQAARFQVAMENITQGVSMFKADGSILVCNDRYLDLYRLPPIVGPGTSAEALTAFKCAAGTDKIAGPPRRSGEGESEVRHNHLRDGRVISVKHRTLPGGGWVATHEDITDLRRAEARIAHMARHDALTDLPNRALFRERLEAALSTIEVGDHLTVLYLDLDHFKEINDTLGHPMGDALLKAVSARLGNTVRAEDLVARLGGDEFSVICLDADAGHAEALGTRIIASLSAPYTIDGHALNIGVSIGSSTAPLDATTADQLIRNADLALYEAKAKGRGKHCKYRSELDQQMQTRRRLEADLRRAMEKEEFELHFQPLVSVQSQRVQGFEALLRWRSPERGLVPPADFIGLAEELGLIVDIGDWVLRQACGQAASWPGDIKVAVNLSSVQFKDANLVDRIRSALADNGLPGSRLELEVTESILVQDVEGTVATLNALRAMGISIAMDDFGTGYSSLNYLRMFPFDKLKIDRAFIDGLGLREDCAAIVRAATSLARSLNMTTTAEGIETEEQLRHVGLEGCQQAQGYLFSRPLPSSEVSEFLRLNEKAAA